VSIDGFPYIKPVIMYAGVKGIKKRLRQLKAKVQATPLLNATADYS
jgi:hypothetical protein